MMSNYSASAPNAGTVNQPASSLTPTTQQSAANWCFFSLPMAFLISCLSVSYNPCRHYDPSFPGRESGLSHSPFYSSILPECITFYKFFFFFFLISCHWLLHVPAGLLNLGRGPDDAFIWGWHRHFITSSVKSEGGRWGQPRPDSRFTPV